MCVSWCSTSFTPCLIKIELINLSSGKEKGGFPDLWPRIPLHYHQHSHTLPTPNQAILPDIIWCFSVLVFIRI